MTSESTYAVVILAVDVVGDCSPHRYKLRSGHDRQEPAFRQKDADDFPEEHSCFASERAAERIEIDEPVQAIGCKDYAVGLETTVAIAATLAMRHYRPI